MGIGRSGQNILCRACGCSRDAFVDVEAQTCGKRPERMSAGGRQSEALASRTPRAYRHDLGQLGKPIMKPLIAALLLALVAVPAMAGDAVDTTFVKTQGPHPFNVRDLVMMDRVSDPQLSPDGRYAAFGVRSTDYAANKGVNAVYVLDLAQGGQPVKVQDKAGSARWSTDGRSLYFVAPAKGV